MTPDVCGAISTGKNISILRKPLSLAEEIWSRERGWTGSWGITGVASGKYFLDSVVSMSMAARVRVMVYNFRD